MMFHNLVDYPPKAEQGPEDWKFDINQDKAFLEGCRRI